MYAYSLIIRLGKFLRNRDGSLNSRRRYIVGMNKIKTQIKDKGLYIGFDAIEIGEVDFLLLTDKSYCVERATFSNAGDFVEFLNEIYNYIYKDETLLVYLNEKINLGTKRKTSWQDLEEFVELRDELIDFKNNYQPKENKED